MRTHGWGGATPASDEEAVERILDAASAAIDVRGGAIRVADVARALEISRQTVYDFGRVSTEVTSDLARHFGHGIRAGLDVDWAALGFDDEGIDDLVEYMLPMLQSFMVDPGHPPRSGTAAHLCAALAGARRLLGDRAASGRLSRRVVLPRQPGRRGCRYR